MGAWDEKRLKESMAKYEARDDSEIESNKIYTDHYSNPTVILDYLLRLEPYAHTHFIS